MKNDCVEKVIIPEYMKLEKPFIVPDSQKQAKKEFYELVKSRVHIVGEKEHTKYLSDACGIPLSPLGMNIINISNERSGKYVNALWVSVNSEMHYLDGEDYSDLIPYTLEHEIYEAWLATRKSFKLMNLEQNHILALRKEYRIAVREGKGERLLEFEKKLAIKRKDSAKANENAYENASKKFKGAE